jgi:hypothetical protein
MMKRLILSIALGALAAIPVLSFTRPAKAGILFGVDSCYPVAERYQNSAADHPGAYRDGYTQGRESARKGESFKPRTAGGEFARGFEDGYFGRAFTGQKVVVPDTVQYYASGDCGDFSLFGGYDYPFYRGGYYHPFRGGYGYHSFHGGYGYHPFRGGYGYHSFHGGYANHSSFGGGHHSR